MSTINALSDEQISDVAQQCSLMYDEIVRILLTEKLPPNVASMDGLQAYFLDKYGFDAMVLFIKVREAARALQMITDLFYSGAFSTTPNPDTP